MSPSRSRQPAKRAAARRRPATGRDFWGTDEGGDEPISAVRATDDPAAMVTSLGRPPLHGHEVAAERYFEAVYDKAAALAIALAAANGLLEREDDDDSPSQDGQDATR
jgi:hypothetical protein